MADAVRKRGRPRMLDRETGLAVASRLFWKHGYEGTSIADLTKAMGITPPSLYAIFGSKEELYRQVLDYNVEQESSRRVAALRDTKSAYDALAFYLYDAAEGVTQPEKPRGCMISTAALQHAEENEAVAMDLCRRREASIRCMKDRFDQAVQDGDLPASADTEALAHFYSAVVQGMSAQACDGACTALLRRMVDVALQAWPGKRPS